MPISSKITEAASVAESRKFADKLAGDLRTRTSESRSEVDKSKHEVDKLKDEKEVIETRLQEAHAKVDELRNEHKASEERLNEKHKEELQAQRGVVEADFEENTERIKKAATRYIVSS